MALDHETYLKVQGVLDRCHKAGWDGIEELDRLGLIHSPQQILDLKVGTVRDLLAILSTWRPAELLRRKYHPGHQSSPQDMYIVICDFIEDYQKRILEEGP